MTQSELFRALMVAVWDGTNDEADSMIDYRQYENAVTVAHTLGALSTGEREDDGETVRDYLFPDGSTIQVVIRADNIGAGLI